MQPRKPKALGYHVGASYAAAQGERTTLPMLLQEAGRLELHAERLIDDILRASRAGRASRIDKCVNLLAETNIKRALVLDQIAARHRGIERRERLVRNRQEA